MLGLIECQMRVMLILGVATRVEVALLVEVALMITSKEVAEDDTPIYKRGDLLSNKVALGTTSRLALWHLMMGSLCLLKILLRRLVGSFLLKWSKPVMRKNKIFSLQYPMVQHKRKVARDLMQMRVFKQSNNIA
jgi:hypothetical protein